MKEILFGLSLNVSDFIRPEWSIKTIERFIDTLKKHDLKGNIDFTPLTADMVAEHKPEIFKQIREAGFSVGLHGANRPLSSVGFIRDLDWDEAVKAVIDRYTHRIDPRTGNLDLNRDGGWRTIERLFGKPPIGIGRPTLTGSEVAASFISALKNLGARMFSSLRDHLNAESNLCWYGGILCRPDKIFIIPGVFLSYATGQTATSPVRVIESLLGVLPKDGPNIIQLTMHETDFYVAAGRRWYDWERLETAFWPNEVQEKIWRAWDEVAEFITRYRAVTYDDILEMFEDDSEPVLTAKDLLEASQYLLDYMSNWTGHSRSGLPDYVDFDFVYLSLCDVFQALTYFLAYYHEHGSLPEEIKLRDLLGPIDYPRPSGSVNFGAARGYGTVTTVDGKEIIESSYRVASQIKDRLPAFIPLEGFRRGVNAAEFLYLLAQEYRALATGGKPEPAVYIEVDLLPRSVLGKITSVYEFPEKQLWYALLQLWTYKPARLKQSE